MAKKTNGLNTGAIKLLFFVVFALLFSGTVFGQFPNLKLHFPTDVRLEMVFSNKTLEGYNLVVRKKPGMESVMLTDPSGLYPLRALVRNAVNGDERWDHSGVPFHDPHSRYAILSSTIVPDKYFGKAFRLFIPMKIVYNSSPSSTVILDVIKGIRINIVTFDHRFADMYWGKSQDNLVRISPPAEHIYASHHYASPPAGSMNTSYHEASYPSLPAYYNMDEMKREFRETSYYDDSTRKMDDEDYIRLLVQMLREMERGTRN